MVLGDLRIGQIDPNREWWRFLDAAAIPGGHIEQAKHRAHHQGRTGCPESP
jgi:hypothetical protein